MDSAELHLERRAGGLAFFLVRLHALMIAMWSAFVWSALSLRSFFGAASLLLALLSLTFLCATFFPKVIISNNHLAVRSLFRTRIYKKSEIVGSRQVPPFPIAFSPLGHILRATYLELMTAQLGVRIRVIATMCSISENFSEQQRDFSAALAVWVDRPTNPSTQSIVDPREARRRAEID